MIDTHTEELQNIIETANSEGSIVAGILEALSSGDATRTDIIEYVADCLDINQGLLAHKSDNGHNLFVSHIDYRGTDLIHGKYGDNVKIEKHDGVWSLCNVVSSDDLEKATDLAKVIYNRRKASSTVESAFTAIKALNSDEKGQLLKSFKANGTMKDKNVGMYIVRLARQSGNSIVEAIRIALS